MGMNLDASGLRLRAIIQDVVLFSLPTLAIATMIRAIPPTPSPRLPVLPTVPPTLLEPKIDDS